MVARRWNGNSFDNWGPVTATLSTANLSWVDGLYYALNARVSYTATPPKEQRKLERDLRRKQANKKAMLDARSRQCRAPDRGSAPTGARLQTAADAMAARMASRRLS